MAKRIYFRRWQRIIGLSILMVILILVWPFIQPQWNEHWPSAKFSIPATPTVKSPVNSQDQLAVFYLEIASHDPQLLLKLQQAGWPAYVTASTIHIGPYLAAFKTQLNLASISQITPIAVRIVPVVLGK